MAIHVISRGNNRYPLFSEDNEKAYYLRILREFANENKINIFHYCVMNNHVHLIVWLLQGHTLSKCIKQINLKYYYYYRKQYEFTGCLWQGRFKSHIIDSDSYLVQCGKYIELNPVRAGIVSAPEDYPFSSYRYYAYGEPDPLITPSPAYLALSQTQEGRQKRYIDLVTKEMEKGTFLSL